MFYICVKFLEYFLGYFLGGSKVKWLKIFLFFWMVFVFLNYFVFFGVSFVLFVSGEGELWGIDSLDVGVICVEEIYFEENILDYD